MRRAFVLVPILLTWALLSAPAQAIEMATYGKRWCEGTLLHDYQRPLKELPPVQQPPEQLPFGPHNLNFYSTAISRVEVGRGGLGYSFFDETFRNRTLRLNWEITARISRIDRAGNLVRTLHQRTVQVGTTNEEDEIDLWLGTPAGPALYRYDIEFRDLESGALLGGYSEYLRVVRRTFHAGIFINRKTLHPGQSAFARVENRGTEWVDFGLDYAVQHFEHGHWGRDLMAGRAWPLIGISMVGGYAGWCSRYRIPADAPPGRYRFVKSLGSGDRKQGGIRTAVFRVLPR